MIAVESTDVVEEPGMTLPDEIPVDSVQGAVRVVRICTVVTGIEVATTPPEVAVTVTVEAAVTIAGFPETWAAQMPWK